MNGTVKLSKDIRFFKKQYHISVIIIGEDFPGFPCKLRIRGPKRHEPWVDITINNRMLSIGWL